jgi:hypothetical protein
MTWDPSSPPPEAMNTWARWESAHTARTVIAVVGFVLLILAFGTAEPPGGRKSTHARRAVEERG